jgi:hypothetical protein
MNLKNTNYTWERIESWWPLKVWATVDDEAAESCKNKKTNIKYPREISNNYQKSTTK